MPDNTQRFTGRVADYDRYRQRYPAEEILSRLRERCGLTPSWVVADIGAGTGMVAEIFLANGNRVLAVEPNSDMLAHMRATFASPHPHAAQLQVVEATAEATALPDASVDLVAVGRAFHWFDRDRALAEFRRILAPTGWVTLVAIEHSRDQSDPVFGKQSTAFERMMEAHGTDYTQVCVGYLAYDNMERLFDGEFHQAQLHNLRHFFDTYAVDGILTIPTTCWITAASFRR